MGGRIEVNIVVDPAEVEAGFQEFVGIVKTGCNHPLFLPGSIPLIVIAVVMFIEPAWLLI